MKGLLGWDLIGGPAYHRIPPFFREPLAGGPCGGPGTSMGGGAMLLTAGHVPPTRSQWEAGGLPERVLTPSSLLSPPTDVHSCQHPRHAPQLPRRPHHVLPSQGLGEFSRWWQRQPNGHHGHVAPPTLPPRLHRQLCSAQLAHGGLAPRWATVSPAAAAASVDSSTPFTGVRLATPGSPTGCLRTKGPPCHGG